MNLKEKLANIQVQMKAPKNLRNTFGGYNYRNAESILEAFKNYEGKYHVALLLDDNIECHGSHNYVRAAATLIDLESDENITVSALAREAETKKGMDDSQITGATSSYARKYALNGLFLLDDTKDADSDENKIEREARAKKAKKDEAEAKEEEQAKKAAEKTEKQPISKAKAEALEKKLQSEGINSEIVFKLYNVKGYTELTEAQHSNIIAHIKDIKKKQEES